MASQQIDWAEDLVTEVVGERLKAATRKRGAEPLSHAIEAKKLRESWEALARLAPGQAPGQKGRLHPRLRPVHLAGPWGL